MSRDARSYIRTASGGKIWPLDPRPEDVDIEDIAHHLSNCCRWTGATRRFYSVAQHSVLVSQWCPPEYQLFGLLHDASEAYLADVARPIKHDPEFAAVYLPAELRLLRAIFERLGLDTAELVGELPAPVKAADNWILAAEARDLMTPAWREDVETWLVGMPPLPPVPPIAPLSPEEARYWFLDTFEKLTWRPTGDRR